MRLKYLSGLAACMVSLALPLSAQPAAAEKSDPCAAAVTAPGVHFELALRDHGATFQQGEIIPLALSFTSETKDRYWADVRNYDRSGRLDIERYCVEPAAPDPLESWFTLGHAGGGLGGQQALGAAPLTAEAELNEWRTLGPGRYRVFAISSRVWRPPDAREQTSYGRVSEVVRSNAIEIVVNPANPGWQSGQLAFAVRTLADPSSPEELLQRAARTLRFLSTQDSTRQLAKLFWGLNQQQPAGWNLMLGLYGSPYRQLAADSMHAELAAPGHAITREFLDTLVNLRVMADATWDPPHFDPAQGEAAQAFWARRQAHEGEIGKTELRAAAAGLDRKTGAARALTLIGMLTAPWGDPAVGQTVRTKLIAAWADLPHDTQLELAANEWTRIGGPEMLPILRRLAAEPPPAARSMYADARGAVLTHLLELDPAAGRAAIFRDFQDPQAGPSLRVIQLLPKADIATVMRSVVERIASGNTKELDYSLLDRYGDPTALAPIRAAFERRGAGGWSCEPQSAMLRYFLRMDPGYGARQVAAVLSVRRNTDCYRSLPQDLGDQLPKAERSAIDALDDPDPEVARDAAMALGRWGSAAAEKALWGRLERFHKEWEGRHDQLRPTPDFQSQGMRASALEDGLASAIAKGTNWLCPPETLKRLAGLVWVKVRQPTFESMSQQWEHEPAIIHSDWFSDDELHFQVLQYDKLTEAQLLAKLAQFPPNTRFRWQVQQTGAGAVQEAVYERVLAAAGQHGIALEKASLP